MSGQGSTANVLAAIASFFIPGLGQLVQGRLLAAAVQFVLAAALWVVWRMDRAHLVDRRRRALHSARGARPCRLIFRAQVQ
jgi:hypothetical protein